MRRGMLTNRSFMYAMLLCPALLAAGCSPMGGQWKTLADGTSFDGWKGIDSADCGKWMTAQSVALDPAVDGKKLKITSGPGILVNGADGRTCDLITKEEYGDCELHLEFTVAKGSNSGVYLLGRYEIQIFDSFGKKDWTYSDCGGIYPRWINDQNTEGHKPCVNASKAPGEWQTLDVVFRAARFDAKGKKTANARFVAVRLNGALIHKNVDLNGPTRGAMGGNLGPDVAKGPLRLQGDHGPVAFRSIRIRPLWSLW
jgi:3-keto-disaccharide hydrolase